LDIQFFGAARMVTGSNYMVKTKNHTLLVDCGLFQGNEEVEKFNWDKFPYDPKDIDFLILTHAHIDHSGRIPKLVKEGFRGKIFCTKATYDLSNIMLIDSAKIQESDTEWDNKKLKRSGQGLLEPLYTMEDAEYSLKFFEPFYYGQTITINEEITIRFKDAGHILGSTILEMWVTENNDRVKIVFSGDLGMPGRPIINNPDYIEEADYLILESTYGNQIHPPFKDSTKQLIEIINKTALRGGSVFIPSFAVGRTQELIYELNNYYEYNNIEEYMKIPIYIDSPMAVDATEVFQSNASSFNDETKNLIMKGDNPFIFENLRYVKSTEESKILNKMDFPKVVISASGMATAGRIRHHLKHNLWNPLNSLVFVGYQAEGTLGRILLDGVKKVKILGEEIAVGLEIYDLEGFSAHADQSILLEWVSKFSKKPKKIFLIHGEDEPAEKLSILIREEFDIEAIIPNLNSKYVLEKDFIDLKAGISVEPTLQEENLLIELQDLQEKIKVLLDNNLEGVNKKILSKNYDIIKNKTLELQNIITEISIILGR